MASGLVLIDKPAGITSFDVVAKLRKILNTRKIGHAGTLDPMATGLLVLGVGPGTKLLQFLVGVDKQYLATFRLGQSTTTDDAEGELLAASSAAGLTLDQIQAQIDLLTGQILQTPSKVSAIKVNGKRAYNLVREGVDVQLSARPVTVSRFEIQGDLRAEDDLVEFDAIVDCSSGTFVRALARDLGEALKVGGHISALHRTKVGDYDIANAELINPEIVPLGLEAAASEIFPVLEISSDYERDIGHGKTIPGDGPARVCAVSSGRLVAILERSAQSYRSLVVFPKDLDD